MLGFPCNDFGAQEPGTHEEIKRFCSEKYDVTFPLFAKLHVKGDEQHPLYAALTGKESPFPGDIKWNFGKFLIGRDGKIFRSSVVRPNRPVSMSGSPRALPCIEPSGFRMRGPTIAHCGCASRIARSVPAAPAMSRQSGFMMSTWGALVAASPWLTARANPTFVLLRASLTFDANAYTAAPLPSLEALSTTMPSHAWSAMSSAIDRSARSSSAPAL